MSIKLPVTANLFDLSDLGIAMVSGDDATEFLQGQLSNDINLLQEKNLHQLSAYCNPKGRVLALFHVLRLGTKYALIAPTDILTKVLPRLNMFVMRSAVKIEPDESIQLFGLQLLNDTGLDSLDLGDAKDTTIVQHSNDPNRFFILSSTPPPASTKKIDAWYRIDIQQNLPQIAIQLHEALIPQSINLDIIGGVNFKKGCYPGQEIIARVKYRGKPKTRMISVSTPLNDQFEIGAPIYIDERDGAAGLIINIANDEHGTLMNITVPTSHITEGKLYLNEEKTNKLKRLPSLYEVTI